MNGTWTNTVYGNDRVKLDFCLGAGRTIAIFKEYYGEECVAVKVLVIKHPEKYLEMESSVFWWKMWIHQSFSRLSKFTFFTFFVYRIENAGRLFTKMMFPLWSHLYVNVFVNLYQKITWDTFCEIGFFTNVRER